MTEAKVCFETMKPLEAIRELDKLIEKLPPKEKEKFELRLGKCMLMPITLEKEEWLEKTKTCLCMLLESAQEKARRI
jgi:hypothetical protein